MSPFCNFCSFDVSFPVNSCLNRSFILHLYLQFYYISVAVTWNRVRGTEYVILTIFRCSCSPASFKFLAARLHVFWAIARKNPSTGLTCRRDWEKSTSKYIKNNFCYIYFTNFPRSPQWVDLYRIWYRGSSYNQLCTIFVDRSRGINFVRCWNLPIAIGIDGRR